MDIYSYFIFLSQCGSSFIPMELFPSLYPKIVQFEMYRKISQMPTNARAPQSDLPVY